MFGNFTEETRKILMQSKKEMQELKHPYIGSEHLMLAILSGENNIKKRLKEYGLDYSVFKEEIINIIGVGSKESNCFLYTPLLKRIIEDAILDSKENNNGNITIEHLFSSLLEEGEGIAIRIMAGMNIDLDKLYDEFSYKLIDNKRKKNKKLLVEQLGIDLTSKALNGELDPVVGRDAEVNRIIEILCRRTKNNPILVGEAGVGKTALAEELSNRIVSGNVPYLLQNKKVISLDMASMVAGTKYRGEFEERMRKLLKEVEENTDIILFIDEIHTLVGAGGAEGAIDASNIFKPALARNKLRCIGATTTEEYKKFIEKDSALDRRFQKVFIDKPSKKTVKEILLKLRPIYEKFHLVKISDRIVDLIISMSDKYIYDRNDPDKSIDILDEVCSKVSLKESKNFRKYNELKNELKEILLKKNNSIIDGDFAKASEYKEHENLLMDKINHLELSLYRNNEHKEVTDEDVAEIIHAKTKIPVYELLNNQKMIIKEITNELSKEIYGQDQARTEVINIIKRLKLGFKGTNKCYSLMFCGPSGVGKTTLAKLFGKSMVGEFNTIKIDMSEYSEAHSVSKIIGAPPGYVGYEYSNTLLENIRSNPYSVLILDEIEKAHPQVLSLFYQILDEGKIKDSTGKIVRFDNVFIVMTSNIGYEENYVGFNKEIGSEISNKLKENFGVPFINRIDNIILFNYLDEKNVSELIKNKFKLLKKKYNDIRIKISNSVVKEIIALSNYKEFGARKIDKIINDKLEMPIIDSIINNNNEIFIDTIVKSYS